MREILTIQIGQCGNNIGNKFWEHITHEHGLNPSTGIYEGDSDLQLQRIDVFFTAGRNGKYVPRSINVDLDGTTKDYTLNSIIGGLFPLDHFIVGSASASNNYAKGYHTDGYELLDSIMEVVRNEFENCDLLQGFQIFHSLGGGTGTGLGVRIMEKIREEWPDRIISTLSIVPSPKLSETVVEPYNCILGTSNLESLSDTTYCIDNESLLRIARRYTNSNPTYDDLNRLISVTTSGITTCLRFPGQLNADLRKLAVNMVPFPNLHFLITGFAPLSDMFCVCDKPCLANYRDNLNVPQLINDLFKPTNFMCSCNPEAGKYLTIASIFRGRLSTKEVEENMVKMQSKNSNLFVDWIPSNTKTAVCDIPPRGFKLCGTFIANNTAIRETFVRILDQYVVMFRRQAFLHWYLGEGMELDDFRQAEDSTRHLLDDYELYSENDEGKKALYLKDDMNEKEKDFTKSIDTKTRSTYRKDPTKTSKSRSSKETSMNQPSMHDNIQKTEPTKTSRTRHSTDSSRNQDKTQETRKSRGSSISKSQKSASIDRKDNRFEIVEPSSRDDNVQRIVSSVSTEKSLKMGGYEKTPY